MFSKKVDSKIILILDIQSSVIRGSLVVISSGDLPRVVFTYNVEMNFRTGSDDSLLIKAALSGIKETIQASLRFLHHHGNLADFPHIRRKIYSVHYVLSSPWIVSEAKVLSRKFDKDTEMTQKYISDLVSEDRQKLSSASKESIEIIEQKIFDVRLNRYSVTDWEHKLTKSLEVSFTVSMAGTKMVEYFIDQCKHIVYSNKIHFHSSLLLQYIGIEKVLEPGQNYCLIHVHGNESDVSVVRQKSCIFFGTYSFGVKNLVDEIGKLTNNGRQAADSLLALYTGGKLGDNENSKKEVEAIDKVTLKWFTELKKLLSDAKLEIKPPMSVIVTASSHDDCFVQIIKKSIPGVSVYLLSIDDLSSRVVFEGSSERRRLSALHTIAIHSLLE